MGSPRDRSDRHAGCDPVGAGTAEDPFGQIMRRILRRSPRPSTTPSATSPPADPGVVQHLIGDPSLDAGRLTSA